MSYIPDTNYGYEPVAVDSGKAEELYSSVMFFSSLGVGVIVAFIIGYVIWVLVKISYEVRDENWERIQKQRIDSASASHGFIDRFAAAGNKVERWQVLLDITTEEEVKQKSFMKMFYAAAMNRAQETKERSGSHSGRITRPEIPDDVSMDAVYAPLIKQAKAEYEEMIAAQKAANEQRERFMKALYASHRSANKPKLFGKRKKGSGSSSSSGSSRRSSSGSSSSSSGYDYGAAALTVFTSDSSSYSSGDSSGGGFSGGGDSGSY